MRKEPQRRYASVDQFSRDIQRHLEGRPVIARQDTVGYRAGKFIKRHKFGVIAAVLILATLVGGILMTVRQKRIAERRFNDVRQLANAVLFKYHDAIQNLPGSTPVREMMVKDALVYLDSLSREAAGDPSLQSELAAAYEKVGHVQGHPFHANLGDMTGALASHRKALAIRQSLAAADPSNQQVRQDLAMSYTYVADVLAETGDLNGALDNYGKTLEIYQAMSKADPSNIKLRSRVGVVLDRIGEMQFRTGDLKGSLENHLRSLAIAEEVVKANPDDKREKQNLSISFIKVGERYEENQDYQQALENYRKALAMHEELSAADENNAELRREIALIHDKIGVMQMKMGDREGAMSSHRRTEEIVEALLAKDPKNLLLRGDLTLAQDHLGDLLSAENDVTGALRNYQKSLAVREEVWRDNPNITDAGRYTAISQNKIGDLLFKTGDLDGALQRYLKAAPIDEGLVKTDPQNVLFRRDLAESYSNVAKVHAALAAKTNQAERWRQAKEWYERSLEVWRELHSRNALKPADAEAMEKVKSEIARCEAALAKTL
jgi:non-specific serine/threonine protein kinase/serine/threonine-protein kinase